MYGDIYPLSIYKSDDADDDLKDEHNYYNGKELKDKKHKPLIIYW